MKQLLAALVLLALLAVLVVSAWAWRTLKEPFGEQDVVVEVTVPTGEAATSILARLEGRGVLPHAGLARLYLTRVLGDPPLLAGEYRFTLPLTTKQVLDKLARGEVVTYSVTLIEGLTLEETATALETSGFGERLAFLDAMARSDLIRDLDPDANNLEGYLFPETYSFARGTSESTIVETLVRTFRSHLEEVRPQLGSARSLRELVTLASIVEKEAQLDDERPVIAGVYANRLRRGVALAADPTIIYALKLAGSWDGNLRRPDLKMQSPYNTYVNPGLPPGPICSPGLASLRAAMQPADVSYLYFVSRNDGSHVFADTLREHNRNVERWQKRYWRERWAKERAARDSSP